jgi:uncharacterized protein involved in exopolysaccharide biosynthesis
MLAVRNYCGRQAPRVEQQLASLKREYDLERKAYINVAGKHQAAVLNQDVQHANTGEHFAVLVRPGLPVDAIRGEPIRIVVPVLIFGVTLGVAGVIARERLDRRV